MISSQIPSISFLSLPTAWTNVFARSPGRSRHILHHSHSNALKRDSDPDFSDEPRQYSISSGGASALVSRISLQNVDKHRSFSWPFDWTYSGCSSIVSAIIGQRLSWKSWYTSAPSSFVSPPDIFPVGLPSMYQEHPLRRHAAGL